MKARILSDLHFEFSQDQGKDFIANQNDSDYDLLILAGDIAPVGILLSVFQKFRKAAGNRPIVFVPGNHEYYHSSLEEANNIFSQLDEIHVLNGNVVNIGDVRIVGTTLWFPHSGMMQASDYQINDFHKISDLNQWLNHRSRWEANFLNQNIQENDIVVTHYLPCYDSVDDKFKNSNLNKYFVHNVKPLVEDCGVKLWVHGHTHSSVDYTLGSTRVVCNPCGYPGHDLNLNFNNRLTIDL
jgi:Icc-related predicted phosphoesterase